MTQRSVLTTQSKLTVQAPGFGERGSRQMRHPWRSWRQCTSAGQGWPSVPVAKDGEKGPCALPRVWGRSLERKFVICLRKDVALCHTASRVWDGETEDGSFGWTAHFMCAVCCWKDGAAVSGEAKGRFSCSLRLGRRTDRLGGRHISCAPSVAGKMVRLCHTVSRALNG